MCGTVSEKMYVNIFKILKKLLKMGYQTAKKKKKEKKKREVIAVCESVSKLTK